MTKKQIGSEPIYDARALGTPRMLVLGLQHMFAMFGATVLVPALTGLDVATTLLFAGLGTLLFHLLTKGKVPAFLGSSFAFIGGYQAIAPNKEPELLVYACVGVAAAGLMYVVLSALFKAFGVKKVMRFFPPIVTGPIIIAIGLILAPNAVTNASENWWLAALSVVVIIVCNMWGKGMIKIIPILMGVLIPYIVALCCGMIDFSGVAQADIVGLPPFQMAKFDLSAILIMAPIAIASMMEHIGDISAISATCGENYIEDPGLHRSLIGDGLATSLAALFGGPANTTYGENTGVLVLSRVYDPRVVRIAAYGAIILSFSPAFAEIIHSIPTAIIGGVSFVLYGMISAVGVRNVVENKVDFTNTRNLLIAAVILVSGLGFNGIGGLTFTFGSNSLTLTGLAIAAILGILLNAILPGKDYQFGSDLQGDTSVTFQSNMKK